MRHSVPELNESADRVEVLSPLRWGVRAGLALGGLVPLLAPYELLLRVGWPSHWHPLFLLAALVSTGAAVVSGLLLFAAFAGLSSRMIFDGKVSTFTFSAEAPFVRRSQSVYPLSALERIEVVTREWTDGTPSYCLSVVTKSGQRFASGSAWSREDIANIQQRVEAFLSCAEEPRHG